MHFKIILFGTILLSINCNAGPRTSGNICYDAKICIHNKHEKCGVDGKGFTRRFLDSCDLLEYNCLYNADFVKSPSAKCAGLPPIKDTEPVKQNNEETVPKTHNLNVDESIEDRTEKESNEEESNVIKNVESNEEIDEKNNEKTETNED